jgi:putative phage-type endonuclease
MCSFSEFVDLIETNIETIYDKNWGYDIYYMKRTIQEIKEIFEHIEDECDIDMNKWYSDLYSICFDMLMFMNIPESHRVEVVRKNKRKIRKAIREFCKIKTHEQRTKGWYEFRKKNFTASDFYKIFSDKQLEQVLKKKFTPHKEMSYKPWSLRKGILYEDVAVKVYEEKYNSKVTEFGCLPHHTINGLAASPDGIVIDPNSERYGNMLEIKCVVSRKLNGVIPQEYWTQMQIQMEVCNLYFCDFLECQFHEKPTKEELIEEIESRKDSNKPNIEYYGILIEGKDNKTLIGELNSVEKIEYPNDFVPIEVHYWYLDHMLMRTIKRNEEWFNSIRDRLDYAINKLHSYSPKEVVSIKKEKIKEKYTDPSSMNMCIMLDD